MARLEEIKIKIVFTGGGSGGHVFPLLSVFDILKKLSAEKLLSLEAFYLGPKGFGDEEFKKRGIATKYIMAGKIRRYFSPLNFLDIFKVIFGFFQSLWQIWKFMPDIIFSKGGFGSVPVILAGWVFRIKVFIHESDSVPGISNKIAAKFAKRIAVAFPQAKEYFPANKTAITGNPARSGLFFPASREQTREKYNFSADKPLLLILGGSQGSQRVNDLILEIIEDLIRNDIQVFHQTGDNNFQQATAEGKIILRNLPTAYQNFYQTAGFLKEQDYADLLFACDAVVARAGSGTIFDISFAKKPSILIPLPESAGDHQRLNALAYQKAGAAIVLEEKNILPHLFENKIFDIIKDKKLAEQLSNQAGIFSQPQAAEKIANEIFKLLGIE